VIETGIRYFVDFKAVGLGNENWIHLAQHKEESWPVVNTVMNLGVSVKCGEFPE
jgi:hypothetical protein